MNNTVRLKLIRVSRISLLMIAYCCSLVGIIIIVQYLSTPEKKDLRSGYLLAQAMAHGVDPYLPLPELGKYWLPEHPVTDLLHPTPHPFGVGWLCLPLTLLSYDRAAIVWLLFQLGCLAVSVLLLLRILGSEWEKRRVAVIYCLLLGWWPIILELAWAQLNLFLLVLFLGAWQALRQGKDGLGGALLGGLLLVKLVGWPIVLWLALRRRWRAVWAAGLFWTGAHALAIGLHGWGMVQNYYLKVGPQLSAIYRVFFVNLSLWTVGQRFFGRFGQDLASPPLWESPLLVKALTLLAPAVVLTVALLAALRLRSFDTAIALLIGISPYLNPIAWQHCFLLATPALALLLRRLNVLHWPRRMTSVVVLLLIAISVPHTDYYWFAQLFNPGSNATGQSLALALPALLTLIPLGALCLVLWLLARSESWEEQQVARSSDAIDVMRAGEEILTAR